MTRRIARTATMVEEPWLRFGCVDPGGVIVDLAFERASRRAGAWTSIDQVSPAATVWLARAAAWTAADATIRWFAPARWAADAAYRGEVERALAELELPAALRAQVAAEAAAVPR